MGEKKSLLLASNHEDLEKQLRDRLKYNCDDNRVHSRESKNLEYKKSFNWGSKAEYAKTMAAFANADGGFIVFGIKDSPREIVGINEKKFEEWDPEKAARYLASKFDPEIHWHILQIELCGKSIAAFYVEKSPNAPVICKANDGNDLREGAVYYRYNALSRTIGYAELRELLQLRQKRDLDQLMSQLAKIVEAGPSQVALLDFRDSKLSGVGGTLVISEELIDKISFIKEGQFRESPEAEPVLRIVGDVEKMPPGKITPTEKIPVPTSIGEYEIMLAFLKQEDVEKPTEYIRAACRENVKYIPFFYFAKKAGMGADELRELVSKVKSPRMGKRAIMQRLLGEMEIKPDGVVGKTPEGNERKEILDAIKANDIDKIEQANRIRLFEAITHCSSENINDKLLSTLANIIENEFENYESSTKTKCRKAIAYLDSMLYHI